MAKLYLNRKIWQEAKMFLKDLVFEEGAPFEGEFTVCKIEHRYTRHSNPFMRVQLEDMTGTIKACCWSWLYHGPDNFADFDIVRISGTMCNFADDWQVTVESAALVTHAGRSLAVLIPAGLCPRPDLIESLTKVVGNITPPVLQRFVKQVLSDSEIISRFVTVPSSVNHHHSYPAGNLEHSLECVEVVSQFPDLKEHERNVVVVAALFHDIGKIRTNKSGGLTSEGFYVHHNALTLEVLGNHLRNLDHDWPEAGFMLRHIWSSLHKGPTQSRSPLVGLVAYADQYSAERTQEKRAFAGQKAWKTAAKDPNGNLRMRLKEAA